MALRKDVFELLCLYESPNPQQAFKPNTASVHRDDDHLVFRSQVPDRLEAAYDIALGDDLVEQHLLNPEEQLKLYETLGTYVIRQDQPWRLYPSWCDALVVITPKGRGALAAHRTTSELMPERLTVDLARMTLTLDGVTHDVKSPQALRWVRVLASRPNQWVSGTELRQHDGELDGTRTHRLKEHLPDEVQALIESEQGRGSRLRL